MKKNISSILLLLNIILLFFLTLSMIAPFINPNIFWPISFLGLFFPIIIISIIIFIMIWFFLGKKMVWINLFLVIFSIPFLMRFIAVNLIEKNNKKESIKIMSYNVRLFDAYEWINNDVDNKIVDFINTQKVSILCIQEYYNPNEKLNLNFTYSHIGLQKKKEQWHMAIYSNFPQINKKTVEISGQKMNNTCIYSDIKIHKDTIRVYNIHLASNYFTKKNIEFINSPHFDKETIQKGLIGISRRLKQSFESRGYEVDEIKKHIKNSPYPTIICGDFNDTPVSYAYQELSNEKHDAFIKSGNGIGSTYFKIPGLRIDYILYSQALESKNFITHKEELSDHRAISTEIILPN